MSALKTVAKTAVKVGAVSIVLIGSVIEMEKKLDEDFEYIDDQTENEYLSAFGKFSVFAYRASLSAVKTAIAAAAYGISL